MIDTRPVDTASVTGDRWGGLSVSRSITHQPARVVMFVANDVTRDSRVLREAQTLSDAGYAVTVLGIISPATADRAVETHGGFVIRRLPYRAKPPRWWVPPDFYQRVWRRGSREFKLQRAHLLTAVRLGRRAARLEWARVIRARRTTAGALRRRRNRLRRTVKLAMAGQRTVWRRITRARRRASRHLHRGAVSRLRRLRRAPARIRRALKIARVRVPRRTRREARRGWRYLRRRPARIGRALKIARVRVPRRTRREARRGWRYLRRRPARIGRAFKIARVRVPRRTRREARRGWRYLRRRPARIGRALKIARVRVPRRTRREARRGWRYLRRRPARVRRAFKVAGVRVPRRTRREARRGWRYLRRRQRRGVSIARRTRRTVARRGRRLRRVGSHAARRLFRSWRRQARLSPRRVGVALDRSTARRRMAAAVRPTVGGIGRLIMSGLAAVWSWAWLGGLIAWGSLYLALNVVSRGGLDWYLGWRWRWYGWARYAVANAPAADIWHAHDLTSLPAAHLARDRHGGRAIYDSHEIYVESGRHANQPRWAKSLLARSERHLARRSDAVVTVNESLRQELATRLGIPDITVLYNCPPTSSERPRRSRLRRRLRLAAKTPLLIYHGSLAPHRGIEQLLVAIRSPLLAEAHLVFLGHGSERTALRKEALRPEYGGRVHVLDGVPPAQLLDWLHGADVAVAPIQPSTMNHLYSSPNKVFEAIAVGMPVAGSNFPEFRKVVTDNGDAPLGVLFDPTQPEEIASAVAGILGLSTVEQRALRLRCRRASAERWNWETQGKHLVSLYARLLESPGQGTATELRKMRPRAGLEP